MSDVALFIGFLLFFPIIFILCAIYLLYKYFRIPKKQRTRLHKNTLLLSGIVLFVCGLIFLVMVITLLTLKVGY